MILQDYLDATRRLLRDATATLYPQADLIAYIREARHVRDLDTRMVRKFVGFTLTANQPTYSLADISNNVIPTTFIFGEQACIAKDVVGGNLLPNGGSAGGIGYRYPIARRAFSWMSPYISQSWPSWPTMLTMYGVDTLTFAPVPAFGYVVELDLVGVYPDLTNVNDPEVMADPYNDPVPYLAAAIAKDNVQRFDEAVPFREQYTTRMRTIREGIRQIAIADPYFGRR